MRSEHSDRSYIIDGKEVVYRRKIFHLCATTHNASLKRAPPPVMKNVHSPPTHAKKKTAPRIHQG